MRVAPGRVLPARTHPLSRKLQYVPRMIVHLIDGTYELFRHFYGQRRFNKGKDKPYGAVAGILHSVLEMVETGATHIGVATDHVIESFRNDLWATYKTGEGIDPLLKSQFPLLEDALEALGVAVWAMIEYEADDALASAAQIASDDARVERVIICTPDKDLGQCVGGKVVQLDRRNDKYLDADAVRAKFGVPPESIPDWLALVGDSADGFPGLPGFGAKTAAALLARYGHVEAIPDDPKTWDVPTVRGADRLGVTLVAARDVADRFKDLATLRTDAKVSTVDDWLWRGPTAAFADWSTRLGSPRLAARADTLARSRGAA